METPAQLMTKAKNLAKADSTDYFATVTKGTINGALTGATIGLLYGYFKKYNLYGSALVGVLVGGIVSNLAIKYKN